MNSHRQTQLVIWINQLLFIFSIYFNFSIFAVIISICSLYIFAFISESTVHRYFTHKSYKTNDSIDAFLTFMSVFVGQGSILSWVAVHRTHHAFEDTIKDPHSPLHMPWWKIYLALLPKEYDKRIVFDLLRSKKTKYLVFENKYYFYIWLCIWLVSFMLHPLLFFFIVSGSATWYIATIVVNILLHNGFGNKRYPDAVAFNSKIINFFTGVGYHNNHHKLPSSHNFSHHFSEKDFIGIFIENLLLKK